MILVEEGIHLRVARFPRGGRQGVAFEKFLEGLGVNLKRRVVSDLAFDHAHDVWRDVLSLLPVEFEPLLELSDVTGGAHLNVQLDVLGEAGG